jgi:hypothetical protein
MKHRLALSLQFSSLSLLSTGITGVHHHTQLEKKPIPNTENNALCLVWVSNNKNLAEITKNATIIGSEWCNHFLVSQSHIQTFLFLII